MFLKCFKDRFIWIYDLPKGQKKLPYIVRWYMHWTCLWVCTSWLASKKIFCINYFLLQMFILTWNINLFHTLSEVDFKISLLFCDINYWKYLTNKGTIPDLTDHHTDKENCKYILIYSDFLCQPLQTKSLCNGHFSHVFTPCVRSRDYCIYIYIHIYIYPYIYRHTNIYMWLDVTCFYISNSCIPTITKHTVSMCCL